MKLIWSVISIQRLIVIWATTLRVICSEYDQFELSGHFINLCNWKSFWQLDKVRWHFVLESSIWLKWKTFLLHKTITIYFTAKKNNTNSWNLIISNWIFFGVNLRYLCWLLYLSCSSEQNNSIKLAFYWDFFVLRILMILQLKTNLSIARA